MTLFMKSIEGRSCNLQRIGLKKFTFGLWNILNNNIFIPLLIKIPKKDNGSFYETLLGLQYHEVYLNPSTTDTIWDLCHHELSKHFLSVLQKDPGRKQL